MATINAINNKAYVFNSDTTITAQSLVCENNYWGGPTGAASDSSLRIGAGVGGTQNTRSVYIGTQSCTSGPTGQYNVTIGWRAAYLVGGSGAGNTLIGVSDYNPGDGQDGSGVQLGSGDSYNILINNKGVSGDNRTIRIGSPGSGHYQQNKCYIAGIYNTSVGATAGVVLSDSSHQLGGLAGSAGTVLVGGAKPSFTDSPTLTTVNATTFDTNVTAAGVTLSGTTLSADGTDADININITAKGAGQVIIDDLQLTTDLAVTEGGTGASTLTDHAVLVGSGTAAITPLAVGATGEILVGSTGADPAWSASPTVTTMYATTFDTNVAAAGVTLSGTTLSADGSDADININITAKGAGQVIIDDLKLTTDLAVADGGTGASTLDDHAVLVGSGTSAITPLAVGATGEVLIGNTGADPSWSGSPTVTTLYATTFDTNVAAAGVTLAGTTLSADGTDADININITAKGTGQVIIDDLKLTTDLAVSEGGTGASTLTQNGVLYGNAASAIGATAEGATGEIFIGTTGSAPSWLAAGTDGKVLTAHTGATPTWETPGTAGWMTKTDANADVSPAIVNTAYTINHATPANLLTITLPATYAVGDRIEIVGNTSGMWKLVAAAGDTIKVGSATTTAGGYLSATNQYDAIEVVCTVADTTWVACKLIGNITVA